MEIIIKIFVLQFVFLIILSLTRLLTKKISIHLQNILNLLILFVIIIIYQNQINTVLLIKFYFSNAVIFTILLSTLERSVALGLLRKIYLKKEIHIKDLEKSFNIETLIFQRTNKTPSKVFREDSSKPFKLISFPNNVLHSSKEKYRF